MTCPYCGYAMPIRAEAGAACRGLWVKCKGRRCGREFEIRISEIKISEIKISGDSNLRRF